jgi:hypothetical protein
MRENPHSVSAKKDADARGQVRNQGRRAFDDRETLEAGNISGSASKAGLFRGWYFKLIDQSRSTVLAVIPGIAIGKNGQDAHAFIQLIDPSPERQSIFGFRLVFSADANRFNVSIGANRFSDQGIEIDLANESARISCKLQLIRSKNSRGRFSAPESWAPFLSAGMECYHGIVNISHTISGSLSFNGEKPT